MLQNAYLLAKIGADTAENEPTFCRTFAKHWQLPHLAVKLQPYSAAAAWPAGRDAGGARHPGAAVRVCRS